MGDTVATAKILRIVVTEDEAGAQQVEMSAGASVDGMVDVPTTGHGALETLHAFLGKGNADDNYVRFDGRVTHATAKAVLFYRTMPAGVGGHGHGADDNWLPRSLIRHGDVLNVGPCTLHIKRSVARAKGWV